MTEPVKTLNIGGVEYAKTEVVDQKSTTKERTNSKGLWEQYKEYNVTLKDGTKLSYQEQPKEQLLR